MCVYTDLFFTIKNLLHKKQGQATNLLPEDVLQHAVSCITRSDLPSKDETTGCVCGARCGCVCGWLCFIVSFWIVGPFGLLWSFAVVPCQMAFMYVVLHRLRFSLFNCNYLSYLSFSFYVVIVV